MPRTAFDDGKYFEFSVYNRDVRAAVKENRRHGQFGEKWADVQIHAVTAGSEAEARSLIARRYPPDQGFVLVDLQKIAA